MKILIISNGHGEDLVGAKLAEKLSDVLALPLVGEGNAYKCKVLGPRKKLPGGGFSLRNFSYLWKDLTSGLIGNLFEYYKALKTTKVDLVIAIGDLIPLLAAKINGAPFVFIGVNKSDYYKWFGYSYTPWEIWLLKSAKKVFTRDQLTAENLRKKGVEAEFVGNPLALESIKYKVLSTKCKTIAFLPGTRDLDIQKNLEDFEEIKKEINKLDPSVEFLTATRETFVEVLEKSVVVIGLSGAGDEQPAGVGIPVVSFPGRGSQYNKKFGEAQTQLLGKALAFVPERDFAKVARKALEILNNPKLAEEMGKIGRERMGGGGAVERLVRGIANEK